MRTSSRSLAVVLFDEVALLDVSAPLDVLTTAGRNWNFRPFKVFTVATAPGRIKTPSQIDLTAHGSFESCPSPEIVLVPGGYGARRALADAAVVDYLARAGATASIVFGVGNGVLLLGKAGLLGEATVSITTEAAELLREECPGAKPDTQARFRKEGKVVTAATAGGAVDAALQLVSDLLGRKQAVAVATALGATPPAKSGEGVEIVEVAEKK
jgi:transcriptional regulator GlxA family with amidase domain